MNYLKQRYMKKQLPNPSYVIITILLLFLLFILYASHTEKKNVIIDIPILDKCYNNSYNSDITLTTYDDEPRKCILFNANNAEHAMNYSLAYFKRCLYKNPAVYFAEEFMFFRHVLSCLSKHVPVESRDFDIFERGKGWILPERKYFLNPHPKFNQDKCVWLTLGIGGELAVHEFGFKKKYPGCKVYGVEPHENSYGDFAKVGTIIPHAAGIENGNSLVMTMDCCKNGVKFIRKPLKIRALHELLDEYVGRRVVHYAALDAESMESIFLDEITYDGKLTKRGVVFCQIDWEVHYDYKYEMIGLKADKIKQILKLIENSPYFPILVTPMYGYHHVTFVNLYHPECESMFKIKDRFYNRHVC